MYKMKRTPDIREFKKEHLLEISDVMNYLKKGFNVEPCIPKEHVIKIEHVIEEEKSKLIDTSIDEK